MKKASGRKSQSKASKKPEVKKKLLRAPVKKKTKKIESNKINLTEEALATLAAQKGMTLAIERHLPVQESSFIPQRYDEDILVLMVRDPWWIFAYWDYTQANKEAALRRLRSEGHEPHKMALRVYEVTCRSIENEAPFFDIEIGTQAFSWYIDVGKPGESWQLEIGFRTASGIFYPFLRSNLVATPSVGLSDCTDETWMLPEESYKKLIEMSFDPTASSLNSLKVREYFERYAKSIFSSSGGR